MYNLTRLAVISTWLLRTLVSFDPQQCSLFRISQISDELSMSRCSVTSVERLC